MERVVCGVFIYPGEMHGPCGHVCARSGTIYILTMTQHQQSALPPILFTTTTKQDDERTPQRRNAMGMAIVCANQGESV
jgi:hypothetical protein